MDPIVNILLAICGSLITVIAVLLYRRLGAIEELVRQAITSLQAEDKLLHGRVSSVESRVVRLETRCDGFHNGGAGS